MWSTGRAERRGFTLIELILVLVLLGVVAAMVSPTLTRFSRARQCRHAADQVLALLQRASARAATDATPYRVEFDTADPALWLSRRHEGAWVRPAASWAQVSNLPSELSLACVDAQGMPVDTIEFGTRGQHDPARIIVRDHAGTTITVAGLYPGEPFRIGGAP